MSPHSLMEITAFLASSISFSILGEVTIQKKNLPNILASKFLDLVPRDLYFFFSLNSVTKRPILIVINNYILASSIIQPDKNLSFIYAVLRCVPLIFFSCDRDPNLPILLLKLPLH